MFSEYLSLCFPNRPTKSGAPFKVRRVSGVPCEQPLGDDGEVLSEVRMVAVDELAAFGLSEKFAQLVRDGFPGKGGYGGEFHALYG